MERPRGPAKYWSVPVEESVISYVAAPPLSAILPHCQFRPYCATRLPSGWMVRKYCCCGPAKPIVIVPAHLPSSWLMLVIGVDGAGAIDPHPTSRMDTSVTPTEKRTLWSLLIALSP